MKINCKHFSLFIFLSVTFPRIATSQVTIQNLDRTIRQNDSLFWKAFNSCDLETMEKYYTDDLEFYHDVAGIARGKAQTLDNTKKNLCGSTNFKLRREEVPGTTTVYPLLKNDTIYGAVFSGDHVFYVAENGNPPRLSGKAKFTHIWLLQNNSWKMSRIISYDHKPVEGTMPKAIIKVPTTTLDLYAGNYTAPQTGKVTVQRNNDHLLIIAGDSQLEIFPEAENKFFVKGRDLVFEFVKGSDGKIQKMVVWENGKKVEEAGRGK